MHMTHNPGIDMRTNLHYRTNKARFELQYGDVRAVPQSIPADELFVASLAASGYTVFISPS